MSAQILVVEDDDAIAAFVTTVLEREGYAVTWVQTGQEALFHIQDDAPNLILLDLMLPGDVDGLQTCRAIRGGEVYIPIVTAKDEDMDKIVGLELGADDYITKPFNTRELLARVRSVLRLAHRSVGHHGRLPLAPQDVHDHCSDVSRAVQSPRLLEISEWRAGRRLVPFPHSL